jgi:hypothetical protein
MAFGTQFVGVLEAAVHHLVVLTGWQRIEQRVVVVDHDQKFHDSRSGCWTLSATAQPRPILGQESTAQGHGRLPQPVRCSQAYRYASLR